MPWANEKKPYKIWVSEIILQQTRVAQGRDYYLRFLAKFPNVNALAEATEDEVLGAWAGLGYYSRARNMHAAAKHIVKSHDGVFPSSYHDILALKGVGNYTAAAIGSFAFNLPYAVLDGNVFRVFSRILADQTPINQPGASKKYQEIADAFLDRERPALYNQALMNFGAMQCVPQKPACDQCPISSICMSLKQGNVTKIPTKLPKTPRKQRFLYFQVMRCVDGAYLFEKRGNGDIWSGLYQFPLYESEKKLTDEEVNSLATKWGATSIKGPYKQQLTHINIIAYYCELPFVKKAEKKYFKILPENLWNFALPNVLIMYLREEVFPRDKHFII